MIMSCCPFHSSNMGLIFPHLSLRVNPPLPIGFRSAETEVVSPRRPYDAVGADAAPLARADEGGYATGCTRHFFPVAAGASVSISSSSFPVPSLLRVGATSSDPDEEFPNTRSYWIWNFPVP